MANAEDHSPADLTFKAFYKALFASQEQSNAEGAVERSWKGSCQFYLSPPSLQLLILIQ